MRDLCGQFQQIFQGRVGLMGLGNVDYGDDGFGVRLAEELKSEVRSPKSEGRPKDEGRRAGNISREADTVLRDEVIIAGTSPERFIGQVGQEGFDHLIFLDAVEFGGAPGSVVLLDSQEMAARFPQVSTHKISLGLLAKQVEADGRTKAWLLGVQPESVRPGEGLSATVVGTLELLLELLVFCLESGASDSPAVARQERGHSCPLGGRTVFGRTGMSALLWRGTEPECLSLVASAATRTLEVAL
jgi:hydrogenase maturation protease